MHPSLRSASALAVVVVVAVAVSVAALIPSSRASATPTLRLQELRDSGAGRLDPGWSAQKAYAYMGRRPDETYTRLGVPCAAWFGGWVKDRDPYFKRYGGKRATWSVELCWTAPGKSGPTPHGP